MPRLLPAGEQRRICAARRRTGRGPRLLTLSVGHPHSTISKVLRRHGLSRQARPREDLRLLLLERRGAMQARNAALNQLSALVVTAPEHVRERLGALAGERLAQAAARLRPRNEVVNRVLRRLGKRAERLSQELAEAEHALAALVAELAPELLADCAVGPAALRSCCTGQEREAVELVSQRLSIRQATADILIHTAERALLV